MKINIYTEVCCNSFESAIAAEKGGAYRIELCENLSEGGTSPSFVTLKMVLRETKIPTHVLIRPRAGNFIYTDEEMKIMIREIRVAKKLGAAGIVVGCLDENGNIDLKKMKLLKKEAKNLSVTFHRAFDFVKNPFDALEQIIDLGCDRILTSGQKKSALEGSDLLKKLIDKSAGRIIIMPGAGINSENILDLKNKTGATEFHFSASKKIVDKTEPFDLSRTVTDEEEVSRIVKLLNR